VQRYHDATKLVREPPVRQAARQAPTPGQAASGTPLPRRSHDPTTTVGDAIRIRRSARRFEPAAMQLADLGFLLEMAHTKPSLQRTPGIDLYVAAHRVAKLPAGLYRFEREEFGLATARAGPLAEDLVSVCLGQRKAGQAAVAILMAAQLGADGAHARTRRYRDLLLEAGAIGQRLYLAAEAIGLAARNLAAFVDDDLNRLVGLDGQREAIVHLTLAGPGD
jgi:SagB-type dehydrogenase family enzyme